MFDSLFQRVGVIIGGSCHKYIFCRGKTFIVTNICRNKHNFCRDKHVFCRNKRRLLSRQSTLVATKLLVSKHLVSKLLSQQNYVSQQKFCRDKHTFVATKMILVAVPASDRRECFCLRVLTEFSLSESMIKHTRLCKGTSILQKHDHDVDCRSGFAGINTATTSPINFFLSSSLFYLLILLLFYFIY